MPKAGSWQPPTLRFPSISGLRIVGGVWKVGTLGMMVGLLVTGFAVGTSVVWTKAAPAWPEPAQYDASQVKPDATLKEGDAWQPEENQTVEQRELQTQTLQLNISGARAADITIQNIDIGKSANLTDALQIIGANAAGGAAAKSLICDEILISGVEATTLNLANSEIYELVLTNNTADGLSISPTLANSVVDYTVQSDRGAVKIPAVSDGDFDRIIISTTTADSYCRTLTLSNISAYGAGINLDNILAGKLTIQASRIGDGSGIDSASFTIEATTKIASLSSTGNVEQNLSVK